MESIREFEKKYCSRALAVAILLSFLFLLNGQKALCKGVILGSLFSILNFILQGETLTARLASTAKKAFWPALGSILFRHVLLAIPIVIAIRSESFNLFAVMGGLFMVQITLLADSIRKIYPTFPGKGESWKT